MFEMASGRPPFQKATFKALVTSVVLDPVPPVASLSTKLNHLLAALLEKDARHRPEWEALRTHEVWGDDLTLAPSEMPRQPAYDEMCARLEEEERLQGRGSASGSISCSN